MWGWLFLSVGAFATAVTWAFAVREQAVVFTSSMAMVSWSMLSIQREIVVVAGESTVALELGAVRWLLAALALLSMVALIGAIFGAYPETHPETEFSQT